MKRETFHAEILLSHLNDIKKSNETVTRWKRNNEHVLKMPFYFSSYTFADVIKIFSYYHNSVCDENDCHCSTRYRLFMKNSIYSQTEKKTFTCVCRMAWSHRIRTKFLMKVTWDCDGDNCLLIINSPSCSICKRLCCSCSSDDFLSYEWKINN
jgi:hypothetical protein